MSKLGLLAPAFAGLFIAVHSNAATVVQNFSSDPLKNGWQIAGDTNLFQWDSTNHNLRVTWDSSQPNSYFHYPLGTIVARDDDFSIGFDLRVDSIGAGPDTNKPYSFPISVGFLNLGEATRTNFLRGTGSDSPDLVEFAYFWDSGYGATDWPTFADTNSTFSFVSANDYALETLVSGDWYRVVMAYTASNKTMITTLTNLGDNTGLVITDQFSTNFTDFRVDTISVDSYNDTDAFDGSVLAEGAIGNLVVTVPPPPIQGFSGAPAGGVWQGTFLSRSNWLYTLERTTNFVSWTGVSPTTPGNGSALTLQDASPPVGDAFYRVRAQRP